MLSYVTHFLKRFFSIFLSVFSWRKKKCLRLDSKNKIRGDNDDDDDAGKIESFVH